MRSAALKVALPVRYATVTTPVTPTPVRMRGELSCRNFSTLFATALIILVQPHSLSNLIWRHHVHNILMSDIRAPKTRAAPLLDVLEHSNHENIDCGEYDCQADHYDRPM